jgi:5-methylcytosine-specific restriction endonuclease McrA
MPLQDTTKTCTKCGETKPATPEYFARNQANCKACNRAYYVANKARISERKREYHRAYAARNRERLIAKARAYHAANKAREAEYARSYYSKNKERIAQRQRAYYLKNKEYVAARQLIYLSNNPEWARQRLNTRHVRKLQAEGTHAAADIQAQYERQKGRCYWCNVKVGNTYDVDHIVPLSRGGTDWPENIVITCPSCNRSKGNKLPHEWVQGGRLL